MNRPFQLSSSLRWQVWSPVKKLDTISPKLLIIFDPHLRWCINEIGLLSRTNWSGCPKIVDMKFNNSFSSERLVTSEEASHCEMKSISGHINSFVSVYKLEFLTRKWKKKCPFFSKMTRFFFWLKIASNQFA